MIVAQENVNSSEQSQNKVNNKKTQLAGLNYYKSGSKIEDAKIILILLHGYAAPSNALLPVGKKLFYNQDARYMAHFMSCLYPAGPIEAYEGGLAWSELNGEGFVQSQAKLTSFVTKVHEINPSAKIIVGGFSQGAIMTLNLMAKELDFIKGYALFAPANMMLDKPKGIKLKPVFMTHGRKDKVLQFSESLAIKRYLEGKKYPVTWAPHDEGHILEEKSLKSFEVFIKGLLEEGEHAFLKQEYAAQE